MSFDSSVREAIARRAPGRQTRRHAHGPRPVQGDQRHPRAPDGDRLFQSGARLEESLGLQGPIARLGGDEFAILLGGSSSTGEEAREAAETRFSNWCIRRSPSVISPSTSEPVSGSRYCPDHGEDAPTLLAASGCRPCTAPRRSDQDRVLLPRAGSTTARRSWPWWDSHGALSTTMNCRSTTRPKADLDSKPNRRSRVLDSVACTGRRASFPRTSSSRWPSTRASFARSRGRVLEEGHRPTRRVWDRWALDLKIFVNLLVRDLLDPELKDSLHRGAPS